MKKLIGTTICTFLIILSFACEKDDFCISTPVTPNLVIRFHDSDDRDETKQVDSLFVWAQGKDTISRYNNVSTDSIAIPLNTLEENTVYNLAQGTRFLETFTISYTPEEDFVSRSCGFRIIFNDVNLTKDTENTWIDDFSPNTITLINNQANAHVKIFH